jgi:hypothetical protein
MLTPKPKPNGEWKQWMDRPPRSFYYLLYRDGINRSAAVYATCPLFRHIMTVSQLKARTTELEHHSSVPMVEGNSDTPCQPIVGPEECGTFSKPEGNLKPFFPFNIKALQKPETPK